MPRIVLDVEGELTAEECEQLRQLFYDALGEFIGVRGGDLDEPHDTLGYVDKRYPDMPTNRRERKVDEVLFRKQLARRLRRAASFVRVED